MLDVLQLSPYTDELSLTYVITFKIHDYKIMSLNCQSLPAKIGNLKMLIHNLDLLASIYQCHFFTGVMALRSVRFVCATYGGLSTNFYN